MPNSLAAKKELIHGFVAKKGLGAGFDAGIIEAER